MGLPGPKPMPEPAASNQGVVVSRETQDGYYQALNNQYFLQQQSCSGQQQVNAVNPAYGKQQSLEKELCSMILAKMESTARSFPYGEQCADTDGMADTTVTQGAAYGMKAFNRMSARELSEMLCASVTKRGPSPSEIAQIRADYELAKSVLTAERDKLLAQCVKLTRERNEALEQLSARHGAARDVQTGTPAVETPRANPFTGGWATSWRMR